VDGDLSPSFGFGVLRDDHRYPIGLPQFKLALLELVLVGMAAIPGQRSS